jgi:hypothetical protein
VTAVQYLGMGLFYHRLNMPCRVIDFPNPLSRGPSNHGGCDGSHKGRQINKEYFDKLHGPIHYAPFPNLRLRRALASRRTKAPRTKPQPRSGAATPGLLTRTGFTRVEASASV